MKNTDSTPEKQKAGYINPDWISDCCGSRIINSPPSVYPYKNKSFCCEACGKLCEIKQLKNNNIKLIIL